MSDRPFLFPGLLIHLALNEQSHDLEKLVEFGFEGVSCSKGKRSRDRGLLRFWWRWG
jgi:hypothetical protein